ncbi:type I DNA topoisomerase [Candidatus Peregrinibacteria bacterium]|nr:type I DNA topoisomerase [Candidatus Peregrinibacteria bacterium]
MSSNLIIVESPAKAKTLKKFLGTKYTIRASMGHIRDLPKKTLGVDVDRHYKPEYEISPDKKKVVRELTSLLKLDTTVWLATDEDREGESIAWHLAIALKLKKGHTKRIAFHEITKNAVLKALENPREIDLHLVDAQQARRILDRLVGYKLSPLLWKKIRAGLSAGRVQSVAVRLVAEREREIEAFKPEEYWKIEADLESKKGVLTAELVEKINISNGDESKKVVEDLKKSDFKVAGIERRESKREPAPPFITSTLQQEASRKLGYSVKQTMVIAQQLYEGVEHGTEHSGLITYMRTDSYNLSQEALHQAPKIIAAMFGKEYVLSSPRVFTKKARGAQEAHEAIRPTDLSKTPEKLKKHLDSSQYKLYKLIWERTIASQMPAALLDQATISIQAGDYLLAAKGQTIRFAGFMRAYVEGADHPDEALAHQEKILPDVQEGETLKTLEVRSEQKFTQPPPRYTEASLVKKLEAEGIGRPSTYAPTISTIMQRGYIEKKVDKKLYPCEIGLIVNDFLVSYFKDIVDYQFTAHMENKLDDVAEGVVKWVPVIDAFYQPFIKNLETIGKTISKEDVIHETTDEVCGECGAPMKVKFGRNGKFLSCSKYPECKNAKPMKADEARQEALEKEYANMKCEKCGSLMVVKNGRFGEFLACSGYPKCKNTKPLAHTLGIPCPECGKDLTEKRTKRGKIFYGCSAYPQCKFATWHKPIKTPCSVCGGLQTEFKKDTLKCEKCSKETTTNA